MGHCPPKKSFMEEQPLVLLAFLAEFKDMLDSYGAGESKPVQGLAHLLSNSAKKLIEA